MKQNKTIQVITGDIPKQIPCLQQNHGLWYVSDKLVNKMATENAVNVRRSIMFSADTVSQGKWFPTGINNFPANCVKTPKYSVFSMYIINTFLFYFINDQWYIDPSTTSGLQYFYYLIFECSNGM